MNNLLTHKPFNNNKSNQSSSYTLVLTACIDPIGSSQGQKPVKRSHPKLPLQDYHESLKFWFNHQDLRIKKIIF